MVPKDWIAKSHVMLVLKIHSVVHHQLTRVRNTLIHDYGFVPEEGAMI